jgi:predicted nuclease of predicted toxin-antitoxin system
VTFLFDAHFSPKLCQALETVDIEAHHVRVEFEGRADDVDWIAYAGEREWVIVTCDFNIRTRPVEREALRRSGVSALFVRQAAVFQQDARQQVAWFLRQYDQIEDAIRKAAWGTHFEIGVRGSIRRMPGLP